MSSRKQVEGVSRRSGTGGFGTKRGCALTALCLAALGVAVILSGCGGGGSSSSTEGGSTGAGSTTAETTTAASGGLGKPDKASGSPVIFGMLNGEGGAGGSPEVREAAEAAADYVNEYRGGIHGRPIKIVNCPTDGQPATSSQCANQIVEENPLAILGAADTGSAGAFPVWEREGLAYLGGVPLTPVESNAKDAATFVSFNVADNVAAVGYAKEELGVKNAVVVADSSTTGEFIGSVISSAMEGAGISAKTVTVSSNATDLSSAAAAAVADSPELIYVESPLACPDVLKSLQSVGYTSKLMGISICGSPQSIAAAGSAAEGLYFPNQFEGLESGSEDADITKAALAKFASEDIPLDAGAFAGFGTVMNVAENLDEAPTSVLEEPSKVLGLFKQGKENPNWMAHPYTCDGKQVPAQTAVCNGWIQIWQVNGGKAEEVSKGWVNGTRFYKPTEGG